jgi:hypothetical protein
MDNFEKWEVANYINLREMNFYDWLETDEQFDFLYFDIDNDGKKIMDLYDKVNYQIENGSVVFFEGGSRTRDSYSSGMEKMENIKDIVNYRCVTDDIKYSASIIYNEEIHKLEY